MIKNIEQAKRIQSKRANKLKKGYAKAVRRFVLKNYSDNYSKTLNEMDVYLLTKK